VVLDDLSWLVEPGVTGLLGPNGAGKTTLLHAALGLQRLKSGRVSLGEGGRIGFVPQRFTLAGEMTVKDTLAYAAWVNGVDSSACGSAAARVIDLVQLAEQAELRVRNLSGGQRQRLGVAAGLTHDPEVLILDEPTVGLDPGQRLRVREVVADAAAGRVVLLSTHLVEDVAHLCTKVGVLAKGKIQFDGTVAQLRELMGEVQEDSAVYGSDFERSYNALIRKLGADHD